MKPWQRLKARGRVKNGCRWLDENFPGWEKRIDLDTLELSDGAHCICGQVFENKAGKEYGPKNRFGRRTYLHGYQYAESNLFSEANSWITELVNQEIISRRSNSPEKHERANDVARALGFLDDEAVDMPDLQEEWERVLTKRARQRART